MRLFRLLLLLSVCLAGSQAIKQVFDVRYKTVQYYATAIRVCKSLQQRNSEDWRNGVFTSCTFVTMKFGVAYEYHLRVVAETSHFSKCASRSQPHLLPWCVNKRLNGVSQQCQTVTYSRNIAYAAGWLSSGAYTLTVPKHISVCNSLQNCMGSYQCKQVDSQSVGGIELSTYQIQSWKSRKAQMACYNTFQQSINFHQKTCVYNAYWASVQYGGNAGVGGGFGQGSSGGFGQGSSGGFGQGNQGAGGDVVITVSREKLLQLLSNIRGGEETDTSCDCSQYTRNSGQLTWRNQCDLTCSWMSTCQQQGSCYMGQKQKTPTVINWSAGSRTYETKLREMNAAFSSVFE